MKRFNDFFGSYGGRFVAEMLRAPLDDLQEAFLEAAVDPSFTEELEGTLRDFRRPAYASSESRERLPRARGRRHLHQDGRPGAHGRAQDQQRDRPGAPGAADGQKQDHRGDGSRSARRGHGSGLRSAGYPVPGVHGRSGHAPTAAERVLDGAVRRGGRTRRDGFGDAEGRGERGPARLGGEFPHHPLPPGIRPRPVAVSGHGPGVPVGDRPGARLPARGEGRGLRGPGCVRRRRIKRHRVLLPFPRVCNHRS